MKYAIEKIILIILPFGLNILNNNIHCSGFTVGIIQEKNYINSDEINDLRYSLATSNP
jgi:hypothetical protein